MQELEVYLCRHGETDWARFGKHTGRTDVPLTEHGKLESKQLAQRLRKVQWRQVVTSPLQRAAETCELAGLGKDAMRDPDAMEWDYGQYEGLTLTEICKKNASWDLFKDGAPGGESVQQISARADRLLQKLCAGPGNVALFSHGHFLHVLAARWLGLPAGQGLFFYLSVASLSILGFEHGRPVIKLWNGRVS